MLPLTGRPIERRVRWQGRAMTASLSWVIGRAATGG